MDITTRFSWKRKWSLLGKENSRSSEWYLGSLSNVRGYNSPFSLPHLSPLDELLTLSHGCECASEVCVISSVGTNFAISHGTWKGRRGREGETDRVMYYRTEIDYWKRYQSYKHSLPLILQSCDVEPSHRRPSLLIPPPAIHPLSPPLFLSVSFSFSFSLLAFLSILPFPGIPSPPSRFSLYVMECTGCPAFTLMSFQDSLINLNPISLS